MIERITLGEKYYTMPKLISGEENSTFTFFQNIMAQMVEKENEGIKESIVNCIAEFCRKEGKCIDLILIDEDTAKEIIKLGLEFYIDKEAVRQMKEEK